MQTKICSKCENELLVSSFYSSKVHKDGYQSRCKICHKSYRDQHYKDNKQKYIEKSKDWSDKEKEWWEQYKKQFACQICQENETCCIDFHHTNPTDKQYNIALMIGRFTRDKILMELAKTIPVCANCHRKIHAGVISV